MPKTDYSDPEIPFPRLEAKIFTINGETFLLSLWLYEKAGAKRRQILDGYRAGTINEAHSTIDEYSKRYGAQIGSDDIEVEL